MSTLAPPTAVARLMHVRERMRAGTVDALVVTHLPNLRYLTGFVGTAGIVVVRPSRCFLAVDFRYVTVAREIAAALGDDVLSVHAVDGRYEDAIVDLLRREGAARVGIEAAWMSVSRFNAIAAGLAAAVQFPLQSDDPLPVLVPTERLVERGRIVKDPSEIEALREGARRVSAIARRLASF